jgi:LacI family transcriptional regulator
MDGSLPPKEPILLVPAELVARQSSDAFAVNDSAVAQALRFIAEHGHEAIGVQDVAARVATTRRTLSRLFQRSLGRTVHEAITHLRLERVKRQMIESGVALKTVATECGFRDSTHLYKVFRRVEGTSPSEYLAARTSVPSRR